MSASTVMHRANGVIVDTAMSSRTDFAILGAGAIGSILGAHLTRAGRSVTMLVRERRAAQLRSDGLRIKGLTDITAPVQVLTDASQLRGADALIVAMKTPGTAQALEPLRKADIGVAFSIQNGMWKNDALESVFGAERVLGCLANTSGELLPSGEVLFTRNVNIYIGELPAGSSARAEGIARTIDASGVRAAAVPDVLAREWTKFVGWAGLMLMSITTRAATWRYLTDPDCALVLTRLVREVAGIARAAGVTLINEDTLLPLRGILSGSDEEAVQAVLQAGRNFQRNAPDHRMSSLQDLEAGRPLEIEETLGYAVQRARQLQQSAPLLDSLYHLAVAIDRTRRSAG
jgi:2-dehydropantoate 2-reductase